MMSRAINSLKLSKVYPNPDQPRKAFDEGKLQELAASITQYGVLEPIIVTLRPAGYMIVAGERRYRASLLAGLTEIPARVIEADDALVEELALLENVQRQDLNPIEEAAAYHSLLSRGMTLRELAAKLGYKKTGPIEDRLSLLNLMPELQKLASTGDLSPGAAYEISRLPVSEQLHVFERVRKGELADTSKLYTYVQAIIDAGRQKAIFALTPPTSYELDSINTLESTMTAVEKLIAKMQEDNRMKHLEKAAVNSGITADRLALIIKQLQTIRRTILVGETAKEAATRAA